MYSGRKAAEKFHIPLIHTYHTIYEDYTHYLKIPGNQKLKGAVRCFSRICCDRADECLNGYAYWNEEEFCRYYRELFAQTDRSHMARQAMESIRPLSSKTFGKNVEQIYKNLVWQKTKQTTEGHEGYKKIHTVVG